MGDAGRARALAVEAADDPNALPEVRTRAQELARHDGEATVAPDGAAPRLVVGPTAPGIRGASGDTRGTVNVNRGTVLLNQEAGHP